MHRTPMKIFLISCFVLSATDDLCAELVIAKRKIETPLSRHIWGKWELNEELTADLRGRKSNLSAFAVAEFERKKTDLKTVIKKYADRFTKRELEVRLYETGIMTWAGKKYPFALARVEGTTVVFYFREVEGDPFGRLEARNISVAVGAEPDRDILLIGSSLPSHSFKAYRRISGPDETNSIEKKTAE